jgi:hypothetical protein
MAWPPQFKLRFTVRRQTPYAPLEWMPVRALALKMPQYKSARLFTYRHRELVFVVEEATGIAIAVASSVSQCRERANLAINKAGGWNEVERRCREELALLNLGPKPRTHNERL